MEKHSFIPNQLDKTICQTCKRSYMAAHSPLASCDACGSRGEVLLFGEPSNPKSMLLCNECIKKEIDTAVRESTIDQTNNGQARVELHDDRMVTAKQLDQSIRYNGDFFNARTISHEEVRAAIEKDSSLDEAGKKAKFHSFLMERQQWLQNHVFELDKQKHEAITEQLVIKTLRDKYIDLTKDEREKWRKMSEESGMGYNPAVIKAAKPRIKKPAEGTFDRVVQMYMELHKCSKEEALFYLREGSGGKLGNLPK